MQKERSSIEIYARIKPTIDGTLNYMITEGESSNILTLQRLIRNKTATYSFRFNKVVGSCATQNDIFPLVAKPVIDRVLKGYNGTILAYGQTGSGKTYTMIGGTKSYEEHGIIPRTLQYLYQSFTQDEMIYTVHISYLEIYNEYGYDLLTHKNDASELEDFPRITVMEDTNQKYHIRNLSLHPVVDEREALNLLFFGEANRVIAETPMNLSSSRSHCVFTIHLTACTPGCSEIQRSKLHLVDLAGVDFIRSERASKVGLNGVTLMEAKSINRSLHFLERVTVALSEASSKSDATPHHIPYRNSLLTSILRDSLGGNCLTTFIITLAMDSLSLSETLSSCRFSQRAAMIKNVVSPNDEPGLAQEAAMLRDELVKLTEELARLSVEKKHEELSLEKLPDCKTMVDNFLAYDDPYEFKHWSEICMISDPQYVYQCFKILKEYLLKTRKEDENLQRVGKEPVLSEVDQLKKTIEERDIEICNTNKEQIAFKAFIDAGGPGETLNNDLEEIKFIIECKQEEEDVIVKKLQALKVWIDELRQQLDKSNKSQVTHEKKNWLSNINTGDEMDMVMPAYIPNDKEFQLKTALQAYKCNATKLEQLQNERDHMNNSLRKVEIQMKNQFKSYWEKNHHFNSQSEREHKDSSSSSNTLCSSVLNAPYTTSHTLSQPLLQSGSCDSNQDLTKRNSAERIQEYEFQHPPLHLKSKTLYKRHPTASFSTLSSSQMLEIFPLSYKTLFHQKNAHLNNNHVHNHTKQSHSFKCSTSHEIPIPTVFKEQVTKFDEPATSRPSCQLQPLGTDSGIAKSTLTHEAYLAEKGVFKAFKLPKRSAGLLSESMDHAKVKLCDKEAALIWESCGTDVTEVVKKSHGEHCTENKRQIIEQPKMCMVPDSEVTDISMNVSGELYSKMVNKNVAHVHEILCDKSKQLKGNTHAEKEMHMHSGTENGNSSISQLNDNKEKTDLLKYNLPLTGEKEVDDEIIAFYKARNKMLDRKNL